MHLYEQMEKIAVSIIAMIIVLFCGCSKALEVSDYSYQGVSVDELISFVLPEGYVDVGVCTVSKEGQKLTASFCNESDTFINVGIMTYNEEPVLDTINEVDIQDYSVEGDSLKECLVDEGYSEGYPNVYKTMTSAKGDTYYLCTRPEEGEVMDRHCHEGVTEHKNYRVYFSIRNEKRELVEDEEKAFENMLYGVVFRSGQTDH